MRRVQGVHFGVKDKKNNEEESFSLKEEILQLYNEGDLDKRDIVNRIVKSRGCSRQYVHRILSGKKSRPQKKEDSKAEKVDNSSGTRAYSVVFKKMIVELILERNVTVHAVAREYKLVDQTVHYWIESYDNFKDKEAESLKVREEFAVIQWKRLDEMFKEKPQIKDIAERCGLSCELASRALEAAGVRKRRVRAAEYSKETVKSVEEDIKTAFHTVRHAMTDKEIGEKNGVTTGSISVFRSIMRKEGRLY